jgi:lipopolysaccharide biosynthesis protein
MTKPALSFSHAYRLLPNFEEAADDVVAQLTIEGLRVRQTVILPCAGGLGYFVVPTAGGVVSIDAGGDFRAETLGLVTSLWLRLRLQLLFRKKKYLRFAEFSLFCYGPKTKRKRFTTFNKHMSDTGASLDGELLTGHPELLTGWPAIELFRAVRPPRSQNAAAVAAHVYYEDTWTDIAEALKRVAIPFDLLVTTNPGRERFIERVRAEFPDADIEVVENRGRDLRPFLSLLERGRLDRYRYVCKIHSKKSITAGRRPYLGALWRRRLLFDLLAAPGIAKAIVDRFERDASIGMIGSRAFRIPSEVYPEELAWVGNRPITLALAEKMGVPPEGFRLDFFAGTMFWVRPEALAPLRRLELAEACLDEQGAVDGVIEHALERVFPTAVLTAGYRLETCDGRAGGLGRATKSPLARQL